MMYLRIRYGSPTHRLEYSMEQLSRSIGLEGTFVRFPHLLLIRIGMEESSESYIVKTISDYEMGKLQMVNYLARKLSKGKIGIDEALEELSAIIDKPHFAFGWNLILVPLVNMTANVILIKGTWLDAGVSTGLGVVVGIICHLSSAFPNVPQFTCALVCTFVARALQIYFADKGICLGFLGIVLSSIMAFLPGFSLTLGLIEVSTNNLISGTVRLFSAFFTALVLGYGLSLGDALVWWKPADLPLSCNNEPVPFLFALMLFPVQCIASNILFFKATSHQMLVMSVVPAFGLATYLSVKESGFFGQHVDGPVALSAFVVGLTSNLYSRYTHEIAIAPILSGLIPVMPGAMAVKIVVGLFGQDYIHGLNFAYEIILIGMSLMVGLYMSTILVWPKRGL